MTRHDSRLLRALSSGLALCVAVAMVSSVARADEAPAATDAAKPAATDGTTPAATTESATATTASATTDAGAPAATPAPLKKGGGTDLVTGVPLGTSGQRQEAHILIPRRERAEGKHELTLSFPVQVNGKFVDHFGTGLEYSYHFRETLSAVIGGTYFVRAVQSDFTNTQLLLRTSVVPLAADALLMQYEGHAGLELSPFYGKFAVFNSGVVQFGFFLGAGGGIGKMRLELFSPNEESPDNARRFGDVGFRPVGYFNTGFRMFFGEHVAVRLELRDYVYSAAVQRINGCTSEDLKSLKAGGSVGDGCQSESFVDPKQDANTGYESLKEPSSNITNNFFFAAAFSVLF